MSDASDCTVQLKQVRKVFGRLVAVDNINLDVYHGEFVSLLGPSGCGKTTTLRMIAGFAQPTAGDVFVGGRRVNDIPPYARSCAMVFQNYALFPHLVAHENVAYGLKVRGVPKREIGPKVTRALEMVRMSAWRSHYPKQLSGGQQQRIALARALVIEPDVLLLDEPLSNLDAKLRLWMREEIRSLVKSLNIATIFVTHDQEESLTMSDRIVVMNQAKVEQIGSAEDIYERPETVFVAGFVGNSNLIDEVELLETTDEGSRVLRTKEGFQMYGWPHPRQESFTGKMALSIRPERIYLDRPETVGEAERSTRPNTFVGKIAYKTYIGATIRYRVALSDDLNMLVDHQNRDIAQFNVGDEVCIWWSPRDALLVAHTQPES